MVFADAMDILKIIAQLRWVIESEHHPFDAYRVAKRAGLHPLDVGRAFALMEDSGEILSLGEGGDNPLAESYVRSEK